MKRILFIARNELNSLFYSPIAWIMMILFVITCGVSYFFVYERLMLYFEKGGFYLQFTEFITYQITMLEAIGYIPKILETLYVFFPLMTMGLISREINNGTIKLLYSSPIKIYEIVLGKYLAVIVFTLCLLLIVLLFLLSLVISVDTPDIGQLISILIGFFLLCSAYAAIGLFVSSLTSYQVVAAIATLVIFGIFASIHRFWQHIEFVRDITFYLNMTGKTQRIMNGLISVRDVSYYFLIIVFFLSITIIHVRNQRESVSRLKKLSRYGVVAFVTLALGYITSMPQLNMHIDTTWNKRMTITPPMQNILKNLDGELKITVYCNLFSDYKKASYEKQKLITYNVWDRYTRFKPDFNVDYKYYYDEDTTNWRFARYPGKTIKEIAEKEAKTYRTSINAFLSPVEVNKEVDVRAEGYRTFLVFEYKGKSTFVKTFNDKLFWPSENEIIAAIARLRNNNPVLGFLTDEIERSPFSDRARDYKMMLRQPDERYALIHQGYDLKKISLKSKEPIPLDLNALVIADPRMPFDDESLKKIYNYIDAGGNVFLAVEPDRKEIIRPITEKLGLSLREGMLIHSKSGRDNSIIFSDLTNEGRNISPQFAYHMQKAEKYYGNVVLKINMPGACAVECVQNKGFKTIPLLKTIPEVSWNRVQPINTDSTFLTVNKLDSDEQGSFTTGLYMKRTINGKLQHMLVFGDADFASTAHVQSTQLQVPSESQNFLFALWCFSRFSDNKFPVNTLLRDDRDNSFRLTSKSIPIQKIIFYGVIPGIFAVMSSVIIFRRKRK